MALQDGTKYRESAEFVVFQSFGRRFSGSLNEIAFQAAPKIPQRQFTRHVDAQWAVNIVRHFVGPKPLF